MNIRYTLPILLLLFLTESCALLYQPNMVNVPLHQNDGDMELSANIGFMGANFQGSYAVTNNLFVNLNGNFYNQNDSMDFNRHRLGELALGYFRSLDATKKAIFEFSGGYALAFVEDKGHSEPYGDHIKTNYHKFYIQPSIGAATDYFDGAFSLRFVGLKYDNYNNLSNINDQSGQKGMPLYLEPVLTGRVGYKYVKFSVQGGFSFALSPKHPLAVQGFPFIINLGLSSSFNTKGNK